MSELKEFESPIKEEILKFKKYSKDSLNSKTKILDIIAGFVHNKKENKLIPLLTLLSAQVSGKITHNTYIAASIIDYLYIATRIHDDVEDESYSENIFNKINTLWKEKLSVLMGDYFLAKGLMHSVHNKTYDILEIASRSVKDFTEGELSMIHINNNLHTNKNDYLEIISKKSASLYSTCTMSGALSAGADKDATEKMKLFGFNFGMAQYIETELLFKNTIRSGKYRITLPLILTLENVSTSEKTKILQHLQYPVENSLTTYFQSYIENNNGLENSIRIMEDYRFKAIEHLTEFPYSNALDTLKSMVNGSKVA